MNEVLIDTFKGDDAKLVDCIEALLKLDRDGALVPNGLGGPNSHAWAMLAAAACRLRDHAPKSSGCGDPSCHDQDCAYANSEPPELELRDAAMLSLAEKVDEARLAYLDAYTLGLPDMDQKHDALVELLMDDKGTWGPALRELVQLRNVIPPVEVPHSAATSEPVAWQYRWLQSAGCWSNWVDLSQEAFFTLGQIVDVPYESRRLYAAPTPSPDGSAVREALGEIANRAGNFMDKDAADWMPSIYSIACKAIGEDPEPLLKANGFDRPVSEWPALATPAPVEAWQAVPKVPTDAILKLYGYAPGNYMTKCLGCEEVKQDLDKRASSCRECAETRYARFIEACSDTRKERGSEAS